MTPAAVTPAAQQAATKRSGAKPPASGAKPPVSGEVPGHRRAVRGAAATASRPRRVSGPAAAAARTVRSGAPAPARGPAPGHTSRPPRPARPRRVSGPLSGSAPAGTRALHYLRTLPDHRLLDRLVRGRAWIPVLGVMLVGIVFMQVETLKYGASMGRAIGTETLLQGRNENLRASVAALADDQRIERLAAGRGMVMPAPADVGFLVPSGATTFAQALSAVHAPSPASFLAVAPSNGHVVLAAGTATSAASAVPAGGTATSAATSSSAALPAGTSAPTGAPAGTSGGQ